MFYPMVESDESPWMGYLGFGYPRLSTVRGRQVERPCRQHPVQPKKSRKMRSLRNSFGKGEGQALVFHLGGERSEVWSSPMCCSCSSPSAHESPPMH